MAEGKLDVALSGRFLRASRRRVAAGAFVRKPKVQRSGWELGLHVAEALVQCGWAEVAASFGICLGFSFLIFRPHNPSLTLPKKTPTRKYAEHFYSQRYHADYSIRGTIFNGPYTLAKRKATAKRQGMKHPTNSNLAQKDKFKP